MNNLIKHFARRSLYLKRLYFSYVAGRRGYLPGWHDILTAERDYWDKARQAAKDGPEVLIATSTGGHRPSVTVEGLLAAALTLRGANVHFLLCDEILSGCMLCTHLTYPNLKQFIKYGPAKDMCKLCFRPAYSLYQEFGLPVHRYSELISAAERQKADIVSYAIPFREIGGYKTDGIAAGEQAIAGALRFFARGTLAESTQAEAVLRRYLKAALITTYTARRLLDAHEYKSVVFNHGIYVPQGLIGEVCRQMAVRVVNWNPAYRKNCFIFSEGDTYHHTLMTEPVAEWENIRWDSRMETELMEYLNSRRYGTKDWIWFHDRPEEDLNRITREVGVDFSKPCIGMLTNVLWDAQLHYPANAFPNMLDWIIKTISYFSKRPDIQLLIRIHPAEIRGAVPSCQLVTDEIKRAFPDLPKNVFVIPPDSQVSTYAAMAPCNAVIIYGTKTGVELTSMGIPVIVAGEAWVRNKGITIDVSSVDEYFKTLDTLPLKSNLDEATIRRARQYAYHFFFRRMIPIEYMEPAAGDPPFYMNLPGLKSLLPGRSRGLDVICDGILKGTGFIYPAEDYLI